MDSFLNAPQVDISAKFTVLITAAIHRMYMFKIMKFPFRYTCNWLYLRNLVFYKESTSECPPGYQGHRCLRFCPYPQYGLKCTGKCECSVHLCHHINGCPPPGLWSFDKVYNNIFIINSIFFAFLYIFFLNKTKWPITKHIKHKPVKWNVGRP